MNHEKVLLASILIIASGLLTIALSVNAWAQMYDFDIGNDHYKVYPDQKKDSDVNVQKIKCVNSNVNVNGINITQIPQDGPGVTAANEGKAEDGATNTQNSNGLGDRINFDRNLVNICLNVNLNEQVKTDPSEEPIPLPDTCEECFSVLSDQEKQQVLFHANNEFGVETIQSIGDLCNFLDTSTLPKTELGSSMDGILDDAGISIQDKGFILGCLENLGLILGPE